MIKLIDIILNENLSGQPVYRFISLRGLVPIVKSGILYLMDGDITKADNDASEECKDYKYFLSLTRKGGFKEGYQNSQNIRTKGTEGKSKSPLEKLYVRITFDQYKLDRDFVGKGDVNFRKYKDISKATSMDLRRAGDEDEAEERIFDNRSSIRNISDYIIRIDVYVPEGGPIHRGTGENTSELKLLGTYKKYYRLLLDLIDDDNKVPADKIYFFGQLKGPATKFKYDLQRIVPSTNELEKDEVSESSLKNLQKIVASVLYLDKQKDKVRTIIDNYFGEPFEELNVDLESFKDSVISLLSNKKQLLYDKEEITKAYRTIVGKFRGNSKSIYDSLRNLIQDSITLDLSSENIPTQTQSFLTHRDKLNRLNENSGEWVLEYKDEDGYEEAYFSSEEEALSWARVQEARSCSGEQFWFINLYKA